LGVVGTHARNWERDEDREGRRFGDGIFIQRFIWPRLAVLREADRVEPGFGSLGFKLDNWSRLSVSLEIHGVAAACH
jgi:hypothetical protein